jgi:hypothetical protein
VNGFWSWLWGTPLPPADPTRPEAQVAVNAARGFHRGRVWWHREILCHHQTLIPTNIPSVGPAVWLHCSCDRWWSW